MSPEGVTPDRDGDEPVEFPIEPEIDLHTFHPKDVRSVVDEYISECVKRNFSEVRIVTGRGTGTIREMVRGTLAKNPLVVSYADAPPMSGGWGAQLVQLRGAQDLDGGRAG